MAEQSLVSMLSAPGGGAQFDVASPIQDEREAAIDRHGKVVVLYAEISGKTALSVAGWQVFGTTRKEAPNWSIAAVQDIAKPRCDTGSACASTLRQHTAIVSKGLMTPCR
jgi:protein FrlC